MESNLKREKRILNISFFGSLLFLIAEIIISIITNSHAIFMDCIYDVFDLLMIGPFLLLIPLLYKSETEKRPYGFSQVESLFIMIKSSVLVIVTLYLIYNSVRLIINGGNDVDASTVAIFEICVSITCIIMYLVLSKMKKKKTSPSIEAELYIWKLDSFSTFGVGLAFIIKLLIENTTYSYIGPYIDPVIAIILALFLLKEPIGLCVESVRNLILFAPDDETRSNIRVEVEKVLEDNDCYINFLDIIKTGRKLWVEVYFVTRKDEISINKLRDVHDEIYDSLKDNYDSLYIELIPDIDEIKSINKLKMGTFRRPDKVYHINRIGYKKKLK